MPDKIKNQQNDPDKEIFQDQNDEYQRQLEAIRQAEEEEEAKKRAKKLKAQNEKSDTYEDEKPHEEIKPATSNNLGLNYKYNNATRSDLLTISKQVTEKSDPWETSSISASISNTIYKYSVKKNKARIEGEKYDEGDSLESFKDQEIFEMLSGLSEKTTNISALAGISHAIGNILSDSPSQDVKDRFNDYTLSNHLLTSSLRATKSRDIGNFSFAFARYDLKKISASQELSPNLMQDFTNKISSSFSGLETRDQGLACQALSSLLKNDVEINSEEMLGKIISSAEKNKGKRKMSQSTKGSMARAISDIFTKDPDLMPNKSEDLEKGSLAQRAKDSLVRWSKEVGDTYSMLCVINSVSKLSQTTESTQDKEPLFKNEEVKDIILQMGTRTKDNKVICSVCHTISSSSGQTFKLEKAPQENGEEPPKEVYADERTYNAINSMADKVSQAGNNDSDIARGYIANTISLVSCGKEGGKRFCNQETKDRIVDWGNKTTTDAGAIGICFAITSLAYYESESLQNEDLASDETIFYGSEAIKESIDAMQESFDGRKGSQSEEENKAMQDALDMARKYSTARSQETEVNDTNQDSQVAQPSENHDTSFADRSTQGAVVNPNYQTLDQALGKKNGYMDVIPTPSGDEQSQNQNGYMDVMPTGTDEPLYATITSHDEEEKNKTRPEGAVENETYRLVNPDQNTQDSQQEVGRGIYTEDPIYATLENPDDLESKSPNTNSESQTSNINSNPPEQPNFLKKILKDGPKETEIQGKSLEKPKSSHTERVTERSVKSSQQSQNRTPN